MIHRTGRVARAGAVGAAVLGLVVASAGVSRADGGEADDLLEEQRRMRQLLEEQARRIADLERRLEGGTPAPSPGALAETVEKYLATRETEGPAFSGLTKAKSKFTLYGFVRVDAFHDDSRPNNTQLPGWILSEDDAGGIGDDRADFTMHPRLTRLGVDFDGGTVPSLCDAAVAGKVEVDFYGGGSESRAGLRMRHAYLTLKRDDWQFLAGQTQDLISPLNPVVNNDLVMWGAGNLGDRRPQVRVEYDPKTDSGQLFLQGMFGLTGAIDSKDLDADTYRDGETSGRPTVQARVAYRLPTEKSHAELGVWGHDAKDDPDGRVADETSFRSRAVGFDATVPILEDRVWIKAEGWTGENLTDVRGGIFQGVNTTTGEEIGAKGGFVELGCKVTQTMTAYAGYSLDDPDDGDLPSGGRAKNKIFYAALRFDLNPVEVGIEYLNWTTEYVDLEDGTDHRIGAFVAYKF